MNSRSTAIAAVSAAVLVPLGVFGAPALARSTAAAHEYGHSGSAQYQYKVALCHHTHSKKHPWHVITVSSAAVKAHMKHGDTPAPCPTAPPVQPKHASGQQGSDDSGDQHGKSGDQHGQSGDQHGQSGDQHGQSGSHGNGHGK